LKTQEVAIDRKQAKYQTS